MSIKYLGNIIVMVKKKDANMVYDLENGRNLAVVNRNTILEQLSASYYLVFESSC